MASDGQLLFTALDAAMGLNWKWEDRDETNHMMWENAAAGFIKAILPRFDLSDQGGRVYDIVRHRWLYTGQYVEQADEYKTLIARYGRHHPHCSTGAECTCGFAEVEKRLKI